MIVPESDLIAGLRQFNPWWQSQPLVGPFHEYLQRGGFPPMRLRALHGTAVETATFKHLATRDYRGEVAFAHLKGKKDNEVDVIADVDGRLVPFEVKYRGQTTDWGALKGLFEFCSEKKLPRAYAVTRSLPDFGPLTSHDAQTAMLFPLPYCASGWAGPNSTPSRERKMDRPRFRGHILD